MANIVYLGITSKCNFRCKHCYLTPIQKNRDMPSERIFSFLDECCKEGIFKIVYTHGEVFLHPQWVEVLNYGHKNHLIQNILTNGSLITPEICEQIEKNKVKKVILSLDSANPEFHNKNRNNPRAWDGLRRGIEYLQKYTTTQLSLNSVLSSWTVNELEKMVDIAISWNVPEIRFLPLHNDTIYFKGNNYELLIKKFSELLDYTQNKNCTVSVHDPLFTSIIRQKGYNLPTDICGAGSDFLSVHADGEVFPCNFLNLSLGNIYRQNMAEIIKNANKFVNNSQKKRKINCGQCSLFEKCRGGCAAFSQFQNCDARCNINFNGDKNAK